MRVVADTSVLTHFARVDLFFLLRAMFGLIWIVPETLEELEDAGDETLGHRQTQEAIGEGWMQTQEITDQQTYQRLMMDHPDEVDAKVIVLAVEKQADLLLTDDTQLKILAERERLRVIRSPLLLVQAKEDGLLDAVKPVLDSLIDTGFYLKKGGPVYQRILELSGESIPTPPKN
ncbi:MAG: DUF3368 domain-containing protein [Candidatus Poribacteria bacterium]|nr:DUF3368 domain-containing protein [Candidatus Poribacteria bacterium]